MSTLSLSLDYGAARLRSGWQPYGAARLRSGWQPYGAARLRSGWQTYALRAYARDDKLTRCAPTLGM